MIKDAIDTTFNTFKEAVDWLIIQFPEQRQFLFINHYIDPEEEYLYYTDLDSELDDVGLVSSANYKGYNGKGLTSSEFYDKLVNHHPDIAEWILFHPEWL